MENHIKELKKILQNYEDTDPSFMGEEMKILRHFVLFTHTVVEEALGSLITRNIIASITPPDNKFTPELRQVFSAGTAAMIETDYYRKVELAYSASQIDGSTKSLVEKVNRLRNFFSHPSKFYDELQNLKTDRTKYKEALEVLVSTHEAINNIFRKFYPQKSSS